MDFWNKLATHVGFTLLISGLLSTSPKLVPDRDFARVDVWQTPKYAARDVGAESRSRHPYHGWCFCCGRSWADIETSCGEHMLPYKPDHTCFPACNDCWKTCDLTERLLLAECLCRAWSSPNGDTYYAFDRNTMLDDENRVNLKLLTFTINQEWFREHPCPGPHRKQPQGKQ